MVPALATVVGVSQFGAIRGGVTGAPSFALSLRLRRIKAVGHSVGILFIDLAAAFYTALPEVVLGRLLAPEARDALLGDLALTADERVELHSAFLDGRPLLEQAGLHQVGSRYWRIGTPARLSGSKAELGPLRLA